VKSIGQAQREIVDSVRPLAVEHLALARARGRVLASDVIAARDLPGFDHSAMDGYAARHADLSGADAVPVRGESRAGGAWPEPLATGHAMRIFTGAPMPDGADTVIIQEDVSRDDVGGVDNAPSGGAIRVRELPQAGSNIRRRGSDLATGALALPAGHRIGPGEIALLAALGCARVPAHRPPRVAIVCTGDELRDVHEELPPGALVNSNAYMLAAQVEDAGGIATVLPSAPDRVELIQQRFEEALAHSDLVLTSGGVSVGDHDLVAEALGRAGVETRFWKVAMKPGKPLLFGMHAAIPVLGLPGNPVSAFVGFEVFVRPLLARMRGLRAPFPALVPVQLAHDHRKSKGRPELARGVLARDLSNAVPLASLHARQGSGSLPSIARIDALVFLPGDADTLMAGSALEALRVSAHAEQTEPPFP
jgi:molybdopterin molybdotransferase